MDCWVFLRKFDWYIFEFLSVPKDLGWLLFFFLVSWNEVVSFLFYNKYNFKILIKSKKTILYWEYFIFFIQIRKIGLFFSIFIDAFKVGSLFHNIF
jgi:hypothetical protein